MKSIKIFKTLFLLFLVINSEARVSVSYTKTKQYQLQLQEFIKITVEGINNVSNILNGTGDWTKIISSSERILRGLSPIFGEIGPALAYLNIFLENPMDDSLTEMNKKLDGVLSTINNKFDSLERLVKAVNCETSITGALLEIDTVTSNMRSNMKNAKRQKGHLGSVEVRKFFMEKMKDGLYGRQNVEKAINIIVSLFTSHGSTGQGCNLLEILSDGVQESEGLKGSSLALLQVSLPIFVQLDQAVAYLIALSDANLIQGENAFITRQVLREDWLEKINPAMTALSIFAANLDTPEVFAMNMKENLKRLWLKIKDRPTIIDSTSENWNGYEISPYFHEKISKYFPGKAYAVFTYRDYKENNYYASVRKTDISYRTKSDTPSYDRNYVIELAHTQNLDINTDIEEYIKDADCLEKAYREIYKFRAGKSWASTYVNQSFFQNIDKVCNNRLGGITIVWEPLKGSAVIHSNNYLPSTRYTRVYQQCKWNAPKWCRMNGRLFEIIDQPAEDGWRWRAYIWTSKP